MNPFWDLRLDRLQLEFLNTNHWRRTFLLEERQSFRCWETNIYAGKGRGGRMDLQSHQIKWSHRQMFKPGAWGGNLGPRRIRAGSSCMDGRRGWQRNLGIQIGGCADIVSYGLWSEWGRSQESSAHFKVFEKTVSVEKRELESSLSGLSVNRFFSTPLFSEFFCLRTGGFTTFLSYDNLFFPLPQGIYFEFSRAFDFILLGALMLFLYHNPSCQCNFLLNLYYFSL